MHAFSDGNMISRYIYGPETGQCTVLQQNRVAIQSMLGRELATYGMKSDMHSSKQIHAVFPIDTYILYYLCHNTGRDHVTRIVTISL